MVSTADLKRIFKTLFDNINTNMITLQAEIDTKQPVGEYLTEHQDISGKVDKVTGKGLSSNDFTNSYKNKLDGLSNYDDTSITQTLSTKADISDIPTKTSDLTNDSGFLTSHQDISGKADVNHTHSQYLTEHQSLSNYYTKSETDANINGLSFDKGINAKYTGLPRSRSLIIKNSSDQAVTSILTSAFPAADDIMGFVAADGTTTVANDGYLSVNSNTFYTKSQVDSQIAQAVSAGQVDLSNYYTKTETDTALAGKQPTGSYATNDRVDKAQVSSILSHVVTYDELVTPKIISNGSNLTLKSGCKFWHSNLYTYKTLGEDVTFNITQSGTCTVSTGGISSITNDPSRLSNGINMIKCIFQGANNNILTISYVPLVNMTSDYSQNGSGCYLGQLYFDSSNGISNAFHYENNGMIYASGKFAERDSNININFKKLYDDKADKADMPTKLSDFTNDSGFTTNTGTITGITMNGTSKGTSGVVDLGTVITSHQSLSGCVPTTRKVNNKALSSNITLAGGDIAITSYSKPSSTSALAATDTVNAALGKLEKALDGKQASGSYASSSHTHTKSEVTDMPTKLSDFTNDSGFTTNTGTITGITMNGASKGTSGVVNLGTVITSHQDISGKANTADLAAVATSGSYNDLSNKPTIPTNTNQLTNGAGYITGITSSDITTALGYTPCNVNMSNSTKTYLTETYVNGSNWYRVWSDGFIEQGGIKDNPTTSTNSLQVSLNKQMTTTDYVCLVHSNFTAPVTTSTNANGQSVNRWNGSVVSKATDSFTMQATSGSATYYSWYVAGY